MTDPLQQALAAHQSGNLPEAERLYRALLLNDSRQADALALLALVLGAKGDYDAALQSVEAAVAIDPDAALFHFHYGTVAMGALAAAKSGGAVYPFGMEKAVAEFRRAVALKPDFVEAHYNLANALRAAEDWPGAIESYRAAIALKPDYAEAYNNLALSLVHEKMYDEALAQAKKAVEIAPGYGEGWRSLCNIAEQVKDYALALQAGERCIQLMPGSHFGWFGYGVALNRLDRNEEAIEAYKRALQLEPDRADIWDNLGQTYQSLNRLEEAEEIFRKTIDVAGQTIPDEALREVAEEEYGNRHWHLALIELLRGKLALGFARYRSRFREVGGLRRPDFSRPLWRGEALRGKTLLVTDEQGFGDTLMFCRYLPLLKQQGARIIFSVHPALEPLFRDWHGKDILITHGTGVPPYDFYASVFDLPHRFGTTLATIPAQVPYLPILETTSAPLPLGRGVGEGSCGDVLNQSLHSGKISSFTPPLAPPQGEGNKKPLSATVPKNIGIVWGGSPAHKNDARRSVPLKIFAELFSSDFDFYSFNRDLKEGDAALLPHLPVTDLAPRIHNFADNARFMAQMDLFITCDTALAHLAGGMGRPVWVLLPFAPDWRWLTGRDDNPWYPTARLFRQEKIGDWQGVLQNVRAALKGWE